MLASEAEPMRPGVHAPPASQEPSILNVTHQDLERSLLSGDLTAKSGGGSRLPVEAFLSSLLECLLLEKASTLKSLVYPGNVRHSYLLRLLLIEIHPQYSCKEDFAIDFTISAMAAASMSTLAITEMFQRTDE